MSAIFALFAGVEWIVGRVSYSENWPSDEWWDCECDSHSLCSHFLFLSFRFLVLVDERIVDTSDCSSSMPDVDTRSLRRSFTRWSRRRLTNGSTKNRLLVLLISRWQLNTATSVNRDKTMDHQRTVKKRRFISMRNKSTNKRKFNVPIVLDRSEQRRETSLRITSTGNGQRSISSDRNSSIWNWQTNNCRSTVRICLFVRTKTRPIETIFSDGRSAKLRNVSRRISLMRTRIDLSWENSSSVDRSRTIRSRWDSSSVTNSDRRDRKVSIGRWNSSINDEIRRSRLTRMNCSSNCRTRKCFRVRQSSTRPSNRLHSWLCLDRARWSTIDEQNWSTFDWNACKKKIAERLTTSQQIDETKRIIDQICVFRFDEPSGRVWERQIVAVLVVLRRSENEEDRVRQTRERDLDELVSLSSVRTRRFALVRSSSTMIGSNDARSTGPRRKTLIGVREILFSIGKTNKPSWMTNHLLEKTSQVDQLHRTDHQRNEETKETRHFQAEQIDDQQSNQTSFNRLSGGEPSVQVRVGRKKTLQFDELLVERRISFVSVRRANKSVETSDLIVDLTEDSVWLYLSSD